ncbi:MAG: hypothetical protein L3I99_04375 [Sulfurimonas sp.]|nr:hypothetical protein [Sulfurimonas sp.]
MIKLNNYIFLFAFLPSFILIYNANISKISILLQVDEILLLISIIIIIIKIIRNMHKKIDKIYFVFILYLVYQFINYLVSPFNHNLFLVLIQSLINLKVFLIALATLIVYNSTSYNNYVIKKTMVFFIILFFIGIVVNWTMGSSWNALYDQRAVVRYGILRPIGYYVSTAHVGYFFVLTFVTFYMLMSKEKIIEKMKFLKKFFIFIIIDFLLAFILSTRKGMFMNIPFGLFALSLFKIKEKILILIFLSIFLSVFIYLIKDMEIFLDTQQNISDMSNPETSYIRGLMIYHGVSLFFEFFPFGVGNASFGTVLSQHNTFEVYEYVGLPLHRIYHSNSLHGVYDSGFASMLAENGFFGIFLMFLFIYYFFKFNKQRLDSYNYEIFKMITIFTILLSLTEPNWQNGLYTVFYVINLLYIYTKNNLYREKRKWVKHED